MLPLCGEYSISRSKQVNQDSSRHKKNVIQGQRTLNNKSNTFEATKLNEQLELH